MIFFCFLLFTALCHNQNLFLAQFLYANALPRFITLGAPVDLYERRFYSPKFQFFGLLFHEKFKTHVAAHLCSFFLPLPALLLNLKSLVYCWPLALCLGRDSGGRHLLGLLADRVFGQSTGCPYEKPHGWHI